MRRVILIFLLLAMAVGSTACIDEADDWVDRVSALETALTTAVDTVYTVESTLSTAQAIIASLETDLAAAQSLVYTLQSDLSATQTDVGAIQSNPVLGLGGFVSVDVNTINDLAGPHVIFTGVNVHVRSGSGATDDGGSLTGLGNLVVGYNEAPAAYTVGRGGSHNLALGSENEFSSYGGFVASYLNVISGPYATVSGGEGNTAGGDYSSVNGGFGNTAGGLHSSVSGGEGNYAGGAFSSVSGGSTNMAGGDFSSVSGGLGVAAPGLYNWAAGACYFCPQ